MIPYTLQVSSRLELFQPGIPINRMVSHELFLPDGRRLMSGSIEKSRALVSFSNGFRIMDPVSAALAHPDVMFKEGKQNWVQIGPAVEPDQTVLVYVLATLPNTDSFVLTTFEDEHEVDKPQWLLEPKNVQLETKQITTGLLVIHWGQTARFACIPDREDAEIRFVNVTVTEKEGQPALSYCF